MKKAALLIPGAIAVPAAVCCARAALIKKKPTDASPAIRWTKEEEDLYAYRLSEMIKVPTISKKQEEEYPEFIKFQARMKELFPLTFKTLEDHNIEGNILLRWKGKKEGNGILLMGHQDVVPVDQSGWTRDPFGGDIADGCIHGRGAMDCKSTMCCEFSAVEELIASGFVPEHDIWLFASRNEENSGGGSEAAVEWLKKNGIRLNAVMDEGGAVVGGIFPGLDRDCSAVGIVEKGFCNVKFIARSAGGHASTPPKNSPFIRLSKFMLEVEKTAPFKKEFITPVPEMFKSVAPYVNFPLRLVLSNMWLFGGVVKKVLPAVSAEGGAFIASTCAFTMSGGSTAANVLPDEAYVIANIRPSVHQNAAQTIEVLRKIAAKYDVETEILMERDASNTSSPLSDEFTYLTKCINDCLPDTIATPYLMTGGTDSRQFEAVCDNVLRFTPTRLTSEQLAAMHAANENIGIKAMAEGVKFYRYYIEHRS